MREVKVFYTQNQVHFISLICTCRWSYYRAIDRYRASPKQL